MTEAKAWPPIFIRCDGGRGDGLGHVSRCLTLASAFRAGGAKVTFLSWSPDGTGRRFIEESGFAIIEATAAAATTADLDDVVRHLRTNTMKPILVLDSRAIDARYVEACAGKSLVVCIDDDLLRDLPCHILINNNPWIQPTNYAHRQNRRLLIGTRYNLVRPEYFRTVESSPSQMHVLLTMGGEDPCDQTSKILSALQAQLANHNVTVIIGPAHPSPDTVRFAALDCVPHARIEIGSINLSALFKAANFAITAGGTTCYELAAAGVPQAALVLDDHQEPLVRSLEKAGCCVGLGHYREMRSGRLQAAIGALLASSKKRAALASAGTRLFNKPGGDKIVNSIHDAWSSSGVPERRAIA